MKQIKSAQGHVYGMKLLDSLESGKLKKEYLSNHGSNFTGGLEQMHKDQFKAYLSSCTTILMDERLRLIGREYYG